MSTVSALFRHILKKERRRTDLGRASLTMIQDGCPLCGGCFSFGFSFFPNKRNFGSSPCTKRTTFALCRQMRSMTDKMQQTNTTGCANPKQASEIGQEIPAEMDETDMILTVKSNSRKIPAAISPTRQSMNQMALAATRKAFPPLNRYQTG